MSKLTIGVFSLLGLISVCVGQKLIQDGQCNETVAAVTNFDFLGTWYEVARYPQPTQTGQCNRAVYASGADGVITVQNSQVIAETLSTISGQATPVTDQSGVFQVILNPTGGLPVSQTLYVLDTDYDNYALLYSCSNIDGNTRRRVGSWKLSKQLGPLSDSANAAINDVIDKTEGLSKLYYLPTSQTVAACFYYPQWDTLPATIELPGPCDTTITGIADFNAERFLGTWYEVARYPQPTQTGQCNRAVYASGADGVITVQNSQVIAETLSTISGQATAVTDQSGVFQVILNPTGGLPVSQTLYVLDTDHDNYALLYSCSNIDENTRRRVGSWKLSKQLGPLSDSANAAINDVIDKTEGLSKLYYLPTSQTVAACFYYPQWDTLPATIELPGPCDTTITGIADFNAERFLGTWYEVARYPQPTQTGQCNRAVYASGADGVITVQNSQVIAETLSTISGQATAVAGQSGVLQVTLTTSGGPVTQTLYVLDTDHDNYALLYSCSNIDGNTRRRVGSWKLSKQLGPLSDSANAAINNIIDNTQGLSQSYYLPTSQTDAACFYYPQWDTLPATIELPGPCDTTITGIADFNAERFLGTWYEVARYPQPTQTGQCNRAVYASGVDGVITVQNSQVIAETLSTISGQATAVAGQSGVLQVTLTTSGGPVTQTLYVLDTDHDNYALLYSCSNIDGNTRRRVGSWKLSKQLGPLSDSANAAINNIIDNTQGLSQSYYLPTSQTDAACFYYPQWDTLPATIELPGPCDTTITGIADFNAERFLGTWYEVARYPQPTQTGQCNRAVYASGADGVITVQNSQVIAETLSTISGQATAVAGQSGVLQVTLTTSGGPVTQTLYVLDTDHDNYALLYSCSNIDGNTRRRVGSWKLSKQLGPLSDSANAAINNIIANTQGLSQSYYLPTSQTDAACFYYPQWDTLPATIELPGPCDTTITGIADFTAERFLGTWYEVARYPQPTQTGQCNRAVYASGADGVITVQNSQVIAETLSTISGQATAVAGQSGVLQVTLTTSGGPVTQTLYVLDTDHDNYALLYSCSNIDGNTRRRVGSWKLSKQLGPLSDSANAAINNIIDNTQGLSQSYYLPTSQTDAACFYYPQWDTLPATIELPGPCDTTITGIADFTAERFLGTWYEVARYPQPTQTGQCNRAVYASGADGVITVQNSQVIAETLSTISGQATAVAGQSGVLQVTLTTSGGPVTQTLYVLDTDHDNYALLYSCSNIDGNTRRRVGSWKLSKQLGPLSDSANAAINNIIDNTQGLSQSYYLPTSQTDAACFYYPQWDTLPATIELPGPCDTTITGIADFNAERFLGTWYEVARYPQPTQTGQCNRAVYASGADGVITVQNSQVIAETLSTISGQATAVAGQSGVLQVTLTTSGGPVTQTLYVLDTDHDNYALLYSCSNIDENTRRRVGSWKLSKQLGPLSDSANAAINDVIDNTQGLSQSYYLPTSQTDAACFYYPQWDTLPATIELPGPCDTTITGIADFNAERFLGTWYEVARYPQPTQTGQCNRAVYASGADGVITVQNSQVIAETLSTISGQATAVTDQSGVFQVILNPTGGLPVSQTLYVLDTDYDNYALLYSCSNIDGNTRRRVGSWKLSKQLGPLSDSANAAINDVIDKTEGLSKLYYLPTSQTVAACFYYPQWDTLPATIELPGPCDTTITGIADFNAERFLGTWYEVARYPQPTQTGQCNRAVYASGADGVITVQNSQVIAETLSTISGQATAVTDQSGVFQVILNPTGGLPVSQTLYVLDTDYDNYALLYSCSNIDGNTRRRVGSWKLSKQLGPLSDSANAAINDVIDKTEGLSKLYYLPTSQTVAACFYYPQWDTLPATIELPGPCDTTITGIADFNAERFLGTWYEVARYPQPTQTGQCNRAVYASGADGVITVQNSQVIAETLSTISGQATAVTDQSGVFQVILNPTGGLPVSQTLYVLDTDHDNYALLYSCSNIDENTRRRVGSWKLSKQLGPLSDSANAAINDVIDKTEGLSKLYYLPTSQTVAACFYYPQWDTLPATIELPGPCDTTITGIADFNAERFLGTWYEVARYPQPTQTGQCNRAVYASGADGVITVQNSQVIAETLSTISGQATAVAGQSGVLQVTLTTSGGPVTQTLYVLDTDHDNYALLYSCSNIDGNTRRRVGSWKLSKQLGPLSDSANAAINNIIDNTQGLSQSYYLPTSQTDAACFYYPQWDTLPATIELPGPCDTTITGIADFNAERFLGTWYEVARYPQPTQTGQCNRAVYASGADGVITVQNSQVIAETLSTISGQATAVAGQSGVLQVTLTTSGGPVTQTLYVLDTDHDNYALLYSCSNIDGNTRRRVGSWKLSKQLGPLSDSANAAINNIIDNTQGLSQSYYLPTSQTDAACFYYPQWDTLPATIELPGPCDTTITGIADFNAERFLGTWYEVARYPQPTQTGQCNRAVYASGADGVITVQNSHVIAETLSTISGQATAVAGQSGVLQVALTTSGGPVTQTLYVLDTDHDNYALLYSCSNIDGNTRRRVGSWKLSKQLGPLSDSANVAINNIIDNTQGLSQSYYLPTSQTDAACFHYPKIQAEEKVIIPGQCDTNISGQENINLTRFADGTWYHIQRYDEVGDRSCIGTRLSLEQDFINVYSIEVLGGGVNITEGLARITSAANGQFALVWSGSEDITTITIMATDYDGFTIAYSCENSDSDNRQVGVWLLSRGRTWPAAGVTALEALVEDREEFTLREGYFKAIPQNDYCPELRSSSAFLFKSSIIVIFACTVLQFVL